MFTVYVGFTCRLKASFIMRTLPPNKKSELMRWLSYRHLLPNLMT